MAPLLLFGIKTFITHAVKSKTMVSNAAVGTAVAGTLAIEGLQGVVPPSWWPVILVIVNVWNMYVRTKTTEALKDK